MRVKFQTDQHTSVVVAGWGSSLVVPVPIPLSVLVITIPLVISITIVSTAISPTTLTETKAWSSCFSVVEVDAGSWFVSVVGDREVHANFKTGDFCSIHGISCLLRIFLRFEIDEGKAARSLGWPVQHNLHFLDLPVAPELSLQVSLGSREIQTKHSQTFRDIGIFPVPVDLGGSWKAPGSRLRAGPGGVGAPRVARTAPATALSRPAARS